MSFAVNRRYSIMHPCVIRVVFSEPITNRKRRMEKREKKKEEKREKKKEDINKEGKN